MAGVPQDPQDAGTGRVSVGGWVSPFFFAELGQLLTPREVSPMLSDYLRKGGVSFPADRDKGRSRRWSSGVRSDASGERDGVGEVLC
jgi:hypothetical protein